MWKSGTQEIVNNELMKKIREAISSCTVDLKKQEEKGRKYNSFERDRVFLFYEEPENLSCWGRRRSPISNSDADVVSEFGRWCSFGFQG